MTEFLRYNIVCQDLDPDPAESSGSLGSRPTSVQDSAIIYFTGCPGITFLQSLEQKIYNIKENKFLVKRSEGEGRIWIRTKIIQMWIPEC
jgi:hypothetical protein